MTIAIDHVATAAIAASNRLGDYPNLVVINFGRPGFEYFPISMREIVHWTAYRLDLEDGNHRTASLLRAVAEEFYPNLDDQANWILDELLDQDQDIAVDFEFNEVPPPPVDVRLLGLVDGLAVCHDTFDELLWDGQLRTPVLVRNSSSYLDLAFPDAAFDRYGIRGIRVYCLDLIYWAQSFTDVRESAYQNEDAWLDALEYSAARHRANEKVRSEMRQRARHGDHAVDSMDNSSHPGTTDPAEQDAILAELEGWI